MRTVEDDLWIYFGYPNEFWRNKCTVCREKVGTLKVPVPECIDCWKVEIWSQSPWFVEDMVSAGYGSGDGGADSYGTNHNGRLPQPGGGSCIDGHLGESWHPGSLSGGQDRLYWLAFELAARYGSAFVAKVSKHPLQVVRTGEPLAQYPCSPTDNLLMIYATSVKEREQIRQAVCHALGLDASAAADIPVRRGCWLYDPILGPWQSWEKR
jgi:hypothetical protein